MMIILSAMVDNDYCDDDHHDDDHKHDGDDVADHHDDDDYSPVPRHRTWTPSWAKADS